MAHTGRKPDVESLAVCLFVSLGLHITLTRLCIFSRIPGGSLGTTPFDGMVSGQPCPSGDPTWTLNSQYSILEYASKSSILAIFNTLDSYSLRTAKTQCWRYPSNIKTLLHSGPDVLQTSWRYTHDTRLTSRLIFNILDSETLGIAKLLFWRYLSNHKRLYVSPS